MTTKCFALYGVGGRMRTLVIFASIIAIGSFAVIPDSQDDHNRQSLESFHNVLGNKFVMGGNGREEESPSVPITDPGAQSQESFQQVIGNKAIIGKKAEDTEVENLSMITTQLADILRRLIHVANRLEN